MAKLNKHDQRWIYDYAIKESGTVLHLQGLERGMLPTSVRQLDMVSKHLGRAARKIEKLADIEAARNHKASAMELYFEAANAYAFAQNAILENNREKKALHGRVLACDVQVRKLAPYTIDRMEVPWADGVVAANFHVLPGDEPAPCVVYIPGCDVTKEFYPNPLFNHAHQRGMHIVTVDGPGQGEENLAGVRLTADNYGTAMSTFFDAVAERDDVDETKIVMFGFSFGALWAVQSAAAEPRYAALAAPMTTVSLKNMFAEVPWREPQFSYLTGAQTQEELDAIAEQMDLKYAVPNITCPTLFANGEYDPRSPLDDVFALYDALTVEREMWIFEDQHHQISTSGRPGAGMRGLWMIDLFPNSLDWLRDRIDGVPIERSGEVTYIRDAGQGPYGDDASPSRSWLDAYGIPEG